MDLQCIVKRCQLGDKEAFRELLESVEKEALATAWLISGTRGIAEDIVQEAYIKSFREIKNLKEPQAFKVWFFRILVRTGWELSKKHSRLLPVDTSTFDIAAEDRVCEESTLEGHGLLLCEAGELEDIFDTHEIRGAVRAAVNGLSENLKTVVILYYFNDMSIDEISKVLGCLKATVKSRLYYAREVLKKQLGSYVGRESGFKETDRKECNANG